MQIEKYNVPVPRYTSYPTVPYWQTEKPEEANWKLAVSRALQNENAISLYIHLPFCESLCTYCGCNKRITKNHGVEHPYIQAVLKEWSMYKALFPVRPLIKEIHLGGGTPTFFSPESLTTLIEGILADVDVAEEHEFSFEAHPSSTTEAHLSALAKLGFNRLSIGVQDYDEEILAIINRHQTSEQVENVVTWARAYGYDSINFDLIFGLPLQTKAHIRRTMSEVARLMPERIAFYSYAHVPWISPSQRAYSEADLPKGKTKRALYEYGRQLLEASGYYEIGMDHFALAKDDLFLSWKGGRLHRNFMGYTPHYSQLSIALGASSISDSWDMYIQNEKKIETYQDIVNSGHFPIIKGHELSEEDQYVRGHILRLMCQNETSWENHPIMDEVLPRLEELEADGLIKVSPNHLQVLPEGRPFIRNICKAFDQRFWAKQPKKQVFSQAI
ncbi:MAG: oxygen-independent coproporphyrinogen III oxidase [Saprospiraceae bacterium]|nr:oxygen-independent coproporphyrinogen III oxidase [Saprospiraceae bacterium]